jgi:uncharacterized membrane protein YfcA
MQKGKPMLVIGIVALFIVSFRAEKLTQKHFIWILTIAIIHVAFQTETAHKKMLSLGMRFEWSTIAFIDATIFCVLVLTASLLLGAWLGSRRRTKKIMKTIDKDQ